MLDDLQGDDLLATVGEDALDVGERAVEEAEAAGLHIARPGLELQQGFWLDLEALQVALNLGRGQAPGAEA